MNAIQVRLEAGEDIAERPCFCPNESMNSYHYERGEHRKKHCWKHAHAAIESRDGHLVGKCPNTLTDALAEAILQSAIEEPDPFELPGQSKGHPKKLYAVYNGVIYEAVPTNPGRSYHGYPWTRREGRTQLPREIVNELRRRANEEGCLEKFEDWFDQYG